MKRVVLFILVLLLMADMAEDGCLGKATFVCPHSASKTFLNSPLHDGSGKVDSRDIFLSDSGEIRHLLQSQPVAHLVQPALKIIISNHAGSSGGLPL